MQTQLTAQADRFEHEAVQSQAGAAKRGADIQGQPQPSAAAQHQANWDRIVTQHSLRTSQEALLKDAALICSLQQHFQPGCDAATVQQACRTGPYCKLSMLTLAMQILLQPRMQPCSAADLHLALDCN